MSLQWNLSHYVPEDTAQLGQVPLPVDSPYRRIGDRFDELFPPERLIAGISVVTGRGAIAPSVDFPS